ncbi:MAG: NAD(P)/FAD-dependent oxidoreductase [Rhodopila sp.]|nr:NAD(P)/FAD-dependent oxidoreductase [Rhodopila sp.]
MGEVIKENDLGPHIRYCHEISAASWSSKKNLWTIQATRTDNGEAVRFTANFLWMCQGYYRHSVGYTPEWDGMETFKGQIVHPQTWPEDLDYKGKNVVVIGSGATAATLIPAMANDCSHITMLQRSPTYFRTGRNAIALAEELRELHIKEDVDPRNRTQEDPARSGRVHPPVLHRTGRGEAGTARRGACPSGA